MLAFARITQYKLPTVRTLDVRLQIWFWVFQIIGDGAKNKAQQRTQERGKNKPPKP